MLTRRAFFPCTTIAAARLAHAAPRAHVESTEIISRQIEFYHGWPTLARRKNGELLVTYSGGREAHVCPFGRVDIIRSPDNGKSWSWPETILDTPIDDRDSGVCETQAGSLLVTTFTSLAYEEVLKKAAGWEPQRLARWQAVNRRASAREREELLGTWMLRSTDGGMTWSAPYRVPVNSPHGPVPTSGGRLIYAGKKLWDPGRKVGFCESIDDGITWRWISDIPARPGDNLIEYHELHTIEAADGRIIVQIRNHNPANERETLQCESSDGGRTWSGPRPIGVWGLPSHLLRLRDGRLLMTYGYRRAPFGNLARISEDHGRTWSAPLVISDDGNGSDLGYPSTVELADGQLVTVWYERLRDSPQAALRKAQWSIG